MMNPKQPAVLRLVAVRGLGLVVGLQARPMPNQTTRPNGNGRSLLASRVAKLVYVKLNMHLLGDSAQLEALGMEELNDPVQYTSVLEEAQQLDDEEYVRSITGADSVAPASVIEVVEDGVDEEQPEAETFDWLAGYQK